MPEIGVSFTDERISMLHWYPRVESLDVPVVETTLFELDNITSTFDAAADAEGVSRLQAFLDSLPIEDIISAIEALDSDVAHIRGDYKSSSYGGPDGAYAAPNERSVHENLLHLVDSMVMQNTPLNALCIREHLDLYTVLEESHYTIHPEIRFIVDEGEVLGWFVDVYEGDFPPAYRDEKAEESSELDGLLGDLDEELSEDEDDAPPETQGTYTEYIDEIRALAEADEAQLEEWAQRIATELDDSGWSVDFVMDENGDWHMTDMALYALYWNEDAGRWQNLSHVRSGEPYNLEENPPEDLPEEPTEEMTRVTRR